MLELDHTGPNDDSDLTFECLGRLHINHGDALLQQHARAQIQPHKLQNISEALTRFYFGERGQSSSTPAATQQEKKLRLFGQLSANARVKAAFTLYKEHIGYGGQLVRYPWSTLMSHKGYADSWRLANISQSPLLVDIDADELVHLLYTYAVVFQTEMERRGLKLSLQCPEPRAIREGSALLQSEHLRFSVTLSAICLV